jgi:hypothetical protein
MDPGPRKLSLGALALPPDAPNHNYLSKVATASPDVIAGQLNAELIVSLNVEGLFFAESQEQIPSQKTLNNIKAIMNVALAKAAPDDADKIKQTGQLHRRLSIRER